MRQLVIVGAGGFAQETAAAVDAINIAEPGTWELAGFVDDKHELRGRMFGGVPVIGTVDSVKEMDCHVVVTVGNPHNYFARKRIVQRLDLDDERYATIVHPAANVAARTQLGHGTVMLAGATSTLNAEVGNHVAVMPHALLTHDTVVADYASIAGGVGLAGGVSVGEGAYLGAGAQLREDVGAWSLIGMGSVVLEPVPAGQVWVGNPARFLRSGV